MARQKVGEPCQKIVAVSYMETLQNRAYLNNPGAPFRRGATTPEGNQMSNPRHPKCGKSYPGGPTAGHCSGCCETFIGLGAFEAHRRGEHGVDRHCEITEKHWTDERGFWHYGPKMTDEQKAEMFGVKP